MFISNLFESAKKTAVLTYGRFNPPTVGHQKLVDHVLSIPGDHYIIVSHTQDNKKNPLTAEEKIGYLRKMYPGQNVFHAATKESPTAINAASNLYKQGYTNLVLVVGADRIPAFEKLFNDYNGVFKNDVGYKFDSIKVVSAGDRDPDADDVTGMSASKMRELAVAGDVEGFKQGLHPALQKDAKGMMQKIAAVLGTAKKKKVKETDASIYGTPKQKGIKAARAGNNKKNPYAPGTSSHYQWQQGYNSVTQNKQVKETDENPFTDSDDLVNRASAHSGKSPKDVSNYLKKAHANALKFHKDDPTAAGFNARVLSSFSRQVLAPAGKEHLYDDEELPGVNDRATKIDVMIDKVEQQLANTKQQLATLLDGDDVATESVGRTPPTHTIEAHGIKGMKRLPWRKSFKNYAQLEAWCEKFDAEVYGTRDLDQAKRGNLSPAMPTEMAEAGYKPKTYNKDNERNAGAEHFKKGGKLKDYAHSAYFRAGYLDAQQKGSAVPTTESYGEDDGISIGATVQHKSGGIGKVVKIVDDQQVIVVDDYGQKYKVMISQLSPVMPTEMAEGWKDKAAGLAAAGALALGSTGCTPSADNDWCANHAEPSKLEKSMKYHSIGRSATMGRKLGNRIHNCPTTENSEPALPLDVPPFEPYGDYQEEKKPQLHTESTNPQDTVTFDVPLLIRMMEFAREDAKDDMELHDVVTKLITMSADGKTLSMDQYNEIVSPKVHEAIQRFSESQINEISQSTKDSYRKKAEKEVADLKPHAKPGQEYADIAKNMITRRKKGIARATNETVVTGFGDMRPDQIKREVEAMINDMQKYAQEGNMRAVQEYIKKLEPFVATSRKLGESIDTAIRVVRRNSK